MKFLNNSVRMAAGAACLAMAASVSADYPTKPITMVSPYGPGGAADLAARTLAGTVPAYMGNAVLVVNRTGAAGVTGSTLRGEGQEGRLHRAPGAGRVTGGGSGHQPQDSIQVGRVHLSRAPRTEPLRPGGQRRVLRRIPGRPQGGPGRRREAQLFLGRRGHAAARRHEHGPGPVRNGAGRHEARALQGRRQGRGSGRGRTRGHDVPEPFRRDQPYSRRASSGRSRSPPRSASRPSPTFPRSRRRGTRHWKPWSAGAAYGVLPA